MDGNKIKIDTVYECFLPQIRRLIAQICSNS